ncbi:MAG TPA: peptidylprolyl isomerase [Xanthomonadales bacterium]|nr:peptidylprolyl isomerase [Xanthomonadales bacterium]
MADLTATIKTPRGEIHLKLFPEQAPLTVANFVNLARRKYYDGLNFHRVIPDFMIQGGCPLGSGSGGPGYRFQDEFNPSLRHTPGTLSMANAGPGTNGSQFFITHTATPWLDGKHTVFGRIVAQADQDVVNAIKGGDKIESITILGDYQPLFDKVKPQLDQWNATLDDR